MNVIHVCNISLAFKSSCWLAAGREGSHRQQWPRPWGHRVAAGASRWAATQRTKRQRSGSSGSDVSPVQPWRRTRRWYHCPDWHSIPVIRGWLLLSYQELRQRIIDGVGYSRRPGGRPRRCEGVAGGLRGRSPGARRRPSAASSRWVAATRLQSLWQWPQWSYLPFNSSIINASGDTDVKLGDTIDTNWPKKFPCQHISM